MLKAKPIVKLNIYDVFNSVQEEQSVEVSFNELLKYSDALSVLNFFTQK